MERSANELIEKLKGLSSEYPLGDGSIIMQEPSKLQVFMKALFGRKRLLIIKIDKNKQALIKELKEYSLDKGLDVCFLHAEKITVDEIRGELEVIREEGKPFSQRKKPDYISTKRQMLIVDHLNEKIDIEILKAFCYMGSLDCYYDNLENLPKDKLPYGSAYVFLADKEFPSEKFESISSYWRDEVAVLDLRDFQTKAVEHLGWYKSKIMKLPEKGVYKFRNKEYLYDHILPQEKQEFNIFDIYRNDFFSSEYYSKIKLHKYFHHLNSSQAMCINFFYPLIQAKQLDLIMDLLRLDGKIDYQTYGFVCFEKESKLEESNSRKTNFDFYIKLTSGIEIYFEIKYSENEFGKAKRDKEHIKKYHDTYETFVTSNPAIVSKAKNEDFFLGNYQIMRNLTHIAKDSYVVFLYPEGNEGIRNAALSAKAEIIEKGWKNHFILFTWEDLIGKLKYRLTSETLRNYYSQEFNSKYLNF